MAQQEQEDEALEGVDEDAEHVQADRLDEVQEVLEAEREAGRRHLLRKWSYSRVEREQRARSSMVLVCSNRHPISNKIMRWMFWVPTSVALET